MRLKSSAFKNEAAIPTQFTCEGENISPPLTWDGVPEKSQALALIVDDPDAPGGTFTHWVVYNLPLIPAGLEAGASLTDRLSEGLREGLNDFGKQGYGGPCPPRGHGEHRYFFRLYALGQKLTFEGLITRSQLLDAITGKTLGEAVLMGKYERA
jgi:Raf kinase inhibitor-like YbhB/YbcL family protein